MKAERTAPQGAAQLSVENRVFNWFDLADHQLPGWVYVTLSEPSVPPGTYLSSQFIAFVKGHTDDPKVKVLSKWSVFEKEFEWPDGAADCDCLESGEFSAVSRRHFGDTLVAMAGPMFDQFVIKFELFNRIPGLGADVVSLSFEEWFSAIGVDNAYFVPGFTDFSTPTGQLRTAVVNMSPGAARDAYLRAVDSYINGGLPLLVAQSARTELIAASESSSGYSYLPGVTERVFRKVVTMNAVRLERTLCCARTVDSGSKMFASGMERLANLSAWG